MPAVVLDTNIIVSAALSGGNSMKIMELVSNGTIKLYYSTEILAEYTEVLARPKFRFSAEKQQAFIQKIEELGMLVAAPRSDTPFTDETDRVFFDLANHHQAILVTGNKRHFPDEPFVMTPAEFLDLYD